ncbi:ribonuclease P protein component [Corynebacterium resistens]
MLPPEYRLRSSALFGRTVRNGRKKGSRTVVAYVLNGPTGRARNELLASDENVSRETSAFLENSPQLPLASDPRPRIGLVVSKAVGNAVTRHAVSRRLRHVIGELLVEIEGSCPPGTTIVLRALPRSATATYEEILKDVHSCIKRAL